MSGKYSISAQRDGYLPGTVARSGGARLPAVIQILSGKNLSDVTFRLTPWSVVAGHIRFNDAEPAIGVLVQVYRDAFARGRRSFVLAGSARTNDRGEFRVAGIRPGSYYIAATYDRPAPPEFEERDPVDESGKPIPQFRYSTTFYPAAQKLADAAPVRVAAAQESDGLDIFLEPVRTVNVRGAVTSGLTGRRVEAPSVSLRRLSGDERSSINAAISVQPRSGGFEIRGVAAGPYLLVADTIEDGKRLFARTPVVVSDRDLEGLEVLLTPERACHGSVAVTDAPDLNLSLLRVVFEPRSDLNPTASANVKANGTFVIHLVPDEVYDAYVMNGPDNVYIKSIRVANSTIEADGLSGRIAGPNVSVDITLSTKDAVVAGRVWNADGTPAPGVTVTAVPDPSRGRPQFYRTGYTDQYGLYQIRGLAPGRYTAFAYYDEPPCELYDDDVLAACRTQGGSFSVEESAQAILAIRLNQ